MNFKMLSIIVASSVGFSTTQAKDLQTMLNQGQYEKAAVEFAKGKDNKSKFAAAIGKLGTSLEKLQQGLYKYGFEFQEGIGMVAEIGLPVPHNPKPEQVDYTKFRKLLEDFHEDLHSIEALVEKVGEEDFYLPLDLTKARFDVNKDGKYSVEESSIALFMRMENPRGLRGGEQNRLADFDGEVGFDRSDLLWLKGYVQVCLGVTDALLAHDFRQPFEAIAPSLFQRPAKVGMEVPLGEDGWEAGLANAIAMLHLAKMKVVEPKRMKQSRIHLLNMITDSKIMWKSILAEQDDRKEWLASPKQKSVTGIEINDEMIAQWHVFLDEYEMILMGEKLVPHWRLKGGGINVIN